MLAGRPTYTLVPDVQMSETTREESTRTRYPLPLMPEIAIVTTLILIATPIVLVGAALSMAAKKRLSRRRAEIDDEAPRMRG